MGVIGGHVRRRVVETSTVRFPGTTRQSSLTRSRILQALFDTLTETSHDFNAHRGLYVNCRDKHGRYVPEVLQRALLHTA